MSTDTSFKLCSRAPRTCTKPPSSSEGNPFELSSLASIVTFRAGDHSPVLGIIRASRFRSRPNAFEPCFLELRSCFSPWNRAIKDYAIRAREAGVQGASVSDRVFAGVGPARPDRDRG